VIEFIILKFIESSTCFERHTVHHQELQTVFAASGLYTHVETGRFTGWMGNYHPAGTTAGHHMGIETRGCKYSLKLLMMSWVRTCHPVWTTAGHHMGIETRGCKYSLELLMMSWVGTCHPVWTTAGHHMGIETRGFKYSLELLMMSWVETCHPV
jgi:hypothetical protein